MDLTKREKIGLIGFIIIVTIITSFFYFKDKYTNNVQVIKTSNSSDMVDNQPNNNNDESYKKNTLDQPSKQIYVYITGEVHKPGVYILEEGDRVQKLINSAGGLTPKADTLSINLALKLKDEDHIEVYTKGASSLTGSIDPNRSIGTISNNVTNSQKNNLQEKININTANQERLKELPRIGDALSQRIIDYRNEKGNFTDIKDITNVSGIGTKLFDQIKDKISIQ